MKKTATFVFSDTGLVILTAVVVLLVIFVNFYKFYWTKDYPYLVEAVCDPATELCFERDCTIEDECPPNELSYYRVFEIHAYDFPKCATNSCTRVCTEGEAQCTEIVCGDDPEDVCASTPSQ